ncbi:MAG: hypothetical protein ABS81_00780 [Pseudonocardia sp. SCN 72-86]|nr:MAG: hypothetical protein ABS81_00780 [Pseudonocardia sp. SCN 72-86]
MPDTGWNVVVTGATRNIGLATARAFAERGANLVITARSIDTLESVAQDLRDRGAGRVAAVSADLTTEDGAASLAATALHELGGVDVLVNNALVDMGHAPLLDTDPKVWDRGLQGYLRSPLTLMSAFADSMRRRGRGAVVNLVSTAAYVPVDSLAAYGILKAAMVSMNQYLAHELAPEIRVNAVCPGTTSPDGTTGDSEIWQRIIDRVPLGRMATPEETARTVLFLASDAASYTTGQVVFVDGGRVALAGGRP